jgi:phenol 2-monooxygenase
VQAGRYTAGVATRYAADTVLTGSAKYQGLARGFAIGMRFHSAPVIRLADAKPMQLGHVARADGAWRLYAFADADGSRLQGLMDFLFDSAESPVRRFTPAGADIDSVIEVIGIYQQYHRDLKLEALPRMLLPRKGLFGLIDYEKVYTPDLKDGPDVFDLRGIDRAQGAMVIVRPDQFVANVLPRDAHGELRRYFEAFLLPRG